VKLLRRLKDGKFSIRTVLHPVGSLLTNLLTYLLTFLLTPWSRVLLEELTGLKLVKKFPGSLLVRKKGVISGNF